jgi:hypothetical protein
VERTGLFVPSESTTPNVTDGPVTPVRVYSNLEEVAAHRIPPLPATSEVSFVPDYPTDFLLYFYFYGRS